MIRVRFSKSDIRCDHFFGSKFLPLAAIALAVLGAKPVLATPYDTLQSIAGSYNVFLLGNLGTSSSPYSSDIQGSVAVAGNAYLSSGPYGGSGNNPTSIVVGGNLSQSGGTNNGNVYVGGNATISNNQTNGNVVVGGNLTDSAGSISGNVFVNSGGASANLSGGVTLSGSLNVTGANSTLNAGSNGGSSPSAIYVSSTTNVNDPSYWNTPKVGGGPATPAPPLDVFGSSTDLKNASTSLNNITTSNVATIVNGVLTVNLTQSGMNDVKISIPNGTTISGVNIVTANGVSPTGLVLNVTGDNLAFSGGSFSLGSLSNSQVLFNFGNATAISLSSVSFQGSLLAPLATVNSSNGQFNGALIAANETGSGQFDYAAFTATLPAYSGSASASNSSVVSTPEPGSLIIFGTGLAGFAWLRRQRLSSRTTALRA